MAMLRVRKELTISPWQLLDALKKMGYLVGDDICLQEARMSEDGKDVVLSWAETEREVYEGTPL
jgi:hypothetical protein